MSTFEPRTILRVPESSVVVTRNGELFEIRRGEHTGRRIENPKTWTDEWEWLEGKGVDTFEVETPGRPDTSDMDVQLLHNLNIPLSPFVRSRATEKKREKFNEFLTTYNEVIDDEEALLKNRLFQKCSPDEYSHPYTNVKYSREHALREARRRIGIEYDNTRAWKAALLEGTFTYSGPDSKIQIYRNRSRDTIYYVERENCGILLPLFVHSRTGMLGYNGLASYYLDDLGLAGIPVNVYAMKGGSIVRVRSGIVLK